MIEGLGVWGGVGGYNPYPKRCWGSTAVGGGGHPWRRDCEPPASSPRRGWACWGAAPPVPPSLGTPKMAGAPQAECNLGGVPGGGTGGSLGWDNDQPWHPKRHLLWWWGLDTPQPPLPIPYCGGHPQNPTCTPNSIDTPRSYRCSPNPPRCLPNPTLAPPNFTLTP